MNSIKKGLRRCCRLSADRPPLRSGERYRYSRQLVHSLKSEPFFSSQHSLKREFLLLFSKSNAFSFLSETKRRRSCGGQGEPSWSTRPIHPVRPNGGRLSVETDRWSYPFDQSKDVGSNRHFFLSKMDKTAHKVRQSLPTQIFSNGKKIRFAVFQHAKATKKRAKSPFSNRKNGPRAENAPKPPLICLSEKC